MIWIALALVLSAAMLAALAKYCFDQYMKQRAAEDVDVADPPAKPAETESDPDENLESFVELVRSGPSAQDRRDKEAWKREQLADGRDEDEIDEILSTRTTIVRL